MIKERTDDSKKDKTYLQFFSFNNVCKLKILHLLSCFLLNFHLKTSVTKIYYINLVIIPFRKAWSSKSSVPKKKHLHGNESLN